MAEFKNCACYGASYKDDAEDDPSNEISLLEESQYERLGLALDQLFYAMMHEIPYFDFAEYINKE